MQVELALQRNEAEQVMKEKEEMEGKIWELEAQIQSAREEEEQSKQQSSSVAADEAV